jgi:RNA exonuclease 4
MIFQVGNRDIVFQESVANALNRRFILFLFLFLVLGIPHPAVNTRDVALYQPFRNALKLPGQLVRLPTLTFHLMGRRCQEGQQNPVRLYNLLLTLLAQSLFSSVA